MEISFGNYGQLRDAEATDEEKRIFEIIYDCTAAEDLKFVRKSSNYVSAVIGPTDVARFKYTKRAKWVLLPYVLDAKVKIEDPEDVSQLKDDLIRSVEKAREINNF